MNALLKNWFSIAFLMGKPSDLPGDQTTLKISVVAAIATHILAVSLTSSAQWMIVTALLDVSIAGVCGYLALNWVGKPERFFQAFGSYCGVSVVLNLASIFMLRPMSDAGTPEDIDMIQASVQFVYLVWGISAFAHIVRFTFDITIVSSIGVSTGFLFLNIFVISELLPV